MAESYQPKSHITDGTSLSLLLRIREQDELAWQNLVDLYSPLIYTWCGRCGLNQEDTADIVQDVFTSVARSIGRFRREKEGDTFRGWLRIITRNQIRQHFRKLDGQPQAVGGSTAHLRFQELADSALDEPESETGSEQSGLTHRALMLIRDKFEERTWKAFLQTVVQGRTSADVAKDLNISPGAVRQAKYKVLRLLREEMGEVLD